MKLICFGYLKICDRTTGKVLLGNPVALKSAYFNVYLTEVVKDFGLGGISIHVDKRALNKLKGGSLILIDGDKVGRVSLAKIDISKSLILNDLEQYFIQEATENLLDANTYEPTYQPDVEWIRANQERFMSILIDEE